MCIRDSPVTVYPERAEVHILDDEAAARAYIEQMWAEAMTIYRSRKYKLSVSIEINRYLNAHQQDFMQEDTQAGMIYAYLEDYTCLLYTSMSGILMSSRIKSGCLANF